MLSSNNDLVTTRAPLLFDFSFNDQKNLKNQETPDESIMPVTAAANVGLIEISTKRDKSVQQIKRLNLKDNVLQMDDLNDAEGSYKALKIATHKRRSLKNEVSKKSR